MCCLCKRVAVTSKAKRAPLGAAAGFGEGIAKHFAQEGAKVLVCDVSVEAGEKVAATSEALAFQEMNVTRGDDWQKAIDKAVQLWGKVDILVNNAGTTYPNKASYFFLSCELH